MGPEGFCFDGFNEQFVVGKRFLLIRNKTTGRLSLSSLDGAPLSPEEEAIVFGDGVRTLDEMLQEIARIEEKYMSEPCEYIISGRHVKLVCHISSRSMSFESINGAQFTEREMMVLGQIVDKYVGGEMTEATAFNALREADNAIHSLHIQEYWE